MRDKEAAGRRRKRPRQKPHISQNRGYVGHEI